MPESPPPPPLGSVSEVAALFVPSPEEPFLFETSPATADLSAGTLLPGSAFLERDFLWPVSLTLPSVVSFLFSLFSGDPRLGLLTPQAKFMAWRSLMFLSELHDGKASIAIPASQNMDPSTLYLGRGGYRAAAARGPFYRGPAGAVGPLPGQSQVQESLATSRGKRSVRHALIGDRSSAASGSSGINSLQGSGPAALQQGSTSAGIDGSSAVGASAPVQSGGGSGGTTGAVPAQIQSSGSALGKGHAYPRSSLGTGASTLSNPRCQQGDALFTDSGVIASGSAAASSRLDPSTFDAFRIPTPSLPGVPGSAWGVDDPEAEETAVELWKASKRAVGSPAPSVVAPTAKKTRAAAAFSEASSACDTSRHADAEFAASSASTSAEMHPAEDRDLAAQQSANCLRSPTAEADKAERLKERPERGDVGGGEASEVGRDEEFREANEGQSGRSRRVVGVGDDHNVADVETSKQDKNTSSSPAIWKASPSSLSSERVSRSISGEAVEDGSMPDGAVAESRLPGVKSSRTSYIEDEEDQRIVGYEDNFPRFVCGTIDRRWALQHRRLRVPLDKDAGTKLSQSSPGSTRAGGLSRAGAGDSSTRGTSAEGSTAVELQFEEIKYTAAKKMWPRNIPQLPERLTPGEPSGVRALPHRPSEEVALPPSA